MISAKIRYWGAGLGLLATSGTGVYLDHTQQPNQPLFFWFFLAASLVGILWFLVDYYQDNSNPTHQLGTTLLACLVWRVAYFPNLVFAGFLASLGEALTSAVHPRWALVYPFFLPAVVVLHASSLYLLSLAWRSTPNWIPSRVLPWMKHRKIIAISAVPMLGVATMVSFTSMGDIRLLPDLPWQTVPSLPAMGEPGPNPYLHRVTGPAYNVPQRVLLACAGMTYVLIPHSPWARAVKGTLMNLTNAHPYASSRDRMREHHLAYLVAHQRIRSVSPESKP
jgi:hypothetical protein